MGFSKHTLATGGFAALVLVLLGALFPASASAAISPSAKYVGTYNVDVKINPQYGGEVIEGQMTLNSDGTWTSNALGIGCSESGSWLASGKVLGFSDLDPSGHCDNGLGLTWMVKAIKVGAHYELGSNSAPGYINSPHVFNATWDATLAPTNPAIPQTSSKFSPTVAFVGSYIVTMPDGGATPLTLNQDGTWSFTGACDGGSWLAGAGNITLSDHQCSSNPDGGILMAPTTGDDGQLGNVQDEGLANFPGVGSYNWWTCPQC